MEYEILHSVKTTPEEQLTFTLDLLKSTRANRQQTADLQQLKLHLF